MPNFAFKNEIKLFLFKELDWLNAYHQTCRDKVGALLKQHGKKDALDYLFKETQPIG